MYIFIDKFRLHLGIHDLLLRIKPVIAGKHVADGTAKGIIAGAMETEQLDAKEDGGQRAVRHAAKYRCHPQGCRKRRRQPQQWSGHAAEGRPDEEGRHDLAALKACPQGQCRK